MKINNINVLIDILNDSFFNFLNKDKWTIIKQSSNFNYFDDNIDDIDDIKSLLKLKHNDYKIILPHEAKNDVIDLDEIIIKYSRRIDRFNKIIKSNVSKIIYVGINRINELDKEKLIKCLDDYGCTNYEIKFIEYLNYSSIDDYSWHRDWIPWNELFS
jgi:hypothetical protein